MRDTRPSINPFDPPPASGIDHRRLPDRTISLTCVSAIFSSAFRCVGCATFPSGAPAATFWPSSTGVRGGVLQPSVEPGPHLQLSTWLFFRL